MEDNKGKGGASTYPIRSRVAPIEERIKNPVEFLTELVRDYEHEPEVLVSMIHKHLSHLQYLEGKNLEKIDELEETIDELKQSEARLLPVAEHQQEELNQILKYFESNYKRRAKKISISFQHKRFSDNTGFVIIDVQNPYFMDSLARVLKETVEKCV